ncbi:MAG: flagellar motor switch protein FliN [candidate division Zixibacteria bacterium]|nr:flagellar motor switch protein FliN [candidate division Zixibacteria bacterium]
MADEINVNPTPDDSTPPLDGSVEQEVEAPLESESEDPETPQEPESAEAETPQEPESAEQETPQESESAKEEAPPAKAEGPGGRSEEEEKELEDAMLKMLDDLPQEESSADDISFEKSSASKAEFQQLSQPSGSSEPSNIDLLMDVNLPVSIELGRTKMSISDILALVPGSVVELARLAGEPVDVMVNHKLVAKGEVVVVDENFGVRITQLITPEERIRLLGDE